VKQKLFIFIFLILMGALLVGLNAASYTQKEKTPDTEFSPNRSTFNAGATGTQAFYSLLSETGHKVVRWQQPPAALLTAKNNTPAVFVVTGTVRRPFTPAETEELLRWVSDGGRLVLIDREPTEGLVTTTANWRISFETSVTPEIMQVDASDQKQMIGDTAAIKPIQPTIFTQSVNAVQPSRFASSITFERYVDAEKPEKTRDDPPPPPKTLSKIDNSHGDEDAAERQTGNKGLYTVPSPTPIEMLPTSSDAVESPSPFAPMVHFAAGERNLVVDAPFGSGRIVYLSDPYIISNGGISLVDNAQLAMNLVAAGDRTIAFDEYHQGYGTNSNRFLQFFAGTPVIAIFFQAAILIGLVFFSQSRRFARPVPEPEPDRLSKLEYVAAMAELQSRTGAFDLAIENIYNEFRRRATRYLGLDNYTAKSREIAALIAERVGLDRVRIEETLLQCEDIIHGEPTNRREVLRLAAELRAIEQSLGMTRSARARI
jgi:hypothetical protein